ncbi:fluoride efflux transporter CrcB [Bacillus sp. OAE603]|uniref:fluoride efflux transporter CrcB n=1 Tax=Gottfriedia sp. OAE603 TaxID=2663872 RepID=UPI00178A838B
MILIGLFGGLGAVSRYAIGNFISKYNKTSFPYGTFLINMIGSMLLGITNHFYMDRIISADIWLFLGVGFLGAFTTFSTFSFEAIQLFMSKKYKLAIFYVLLSTILCILSAYLGFNILT